MQYTMSKNSAFIQEFRCLVFYTFRETVYFTGRTMQSETSLNLGYYVLYLRARLWLWLFFRWNDLRV